MLKLLVVLLLGLLLSPCLHAGAMRPCDEPQVFEGAALNVMVLPYRFDGGRPPEDLQLASRQISALVHLELLMSALKYGSIGVTDLLAQPGQVCDVDEVLWRLMRPGTAGRLRPGGALVLVWGRLYEQQGQLHVQSYLRFVRQGTKGPLQEGVALALPAAGAGELRLQASLPAQALAFAPRQIGRAELAQVDQDFRRAMQVRERPDEGAPGRSIAFDASVSFPYWIAEARGDWVRIEPMMGGPAGWVRARQQAGERSLARWLPELAFADAVNGFMRLQAGGLQAAEKAAVALAVEQGLQRYEARLGAELAPTAWGMARLLRGQLAWQAGRRAEAAEHYARAAALLPAYGGARQLAAVARLAATELNAGSAAQLGAELGAALAMAPKDAELRGNLQRLYQLYLRKPAWSPVDEALARERLALLQAPPS